MAPDILGTNPHGRIRNLQQEIINCRYELSCIAQGMRRRLGVKQLNEIILMNRSKIKQIRDSEKAKKKSS